MPRALGNDSKKISSPPAVFSGKSLCALPATVMPREFSRIGSPLVYELNTRCWLRDLGGGKRTVHLGSVPDSEFDRWQRLGITHVWLMGAWTTGPLSRD